MKHAMVESNVNMVVTKGSRCRARRGRSTRKRNEVMTTKVVMKESIEEPADDVVNNHTEGRSDRSLPVLELAWP